MKAGKRHGKGTFIEKKKFPPALKQLKHLMIDRTYVGEFKNDKFNGQGTLTDNHEYAGSKYVGEWKDGEMHGQGIYTFADGRVDKGIFKHDRFVKEMLFLGTKASTESLEALETLVSAKRSKRPTKTESVFSKIRRKLAKKINS